MNAELERVAAHLKHARTPEDVFGKVSGQDCLPAIKKNYHALAKVIHPDLFLATEDKILAHVAFGQLIEWFRQAEEQAKLGIYGQSDHRPGKMLLQTKYHLYCIDDQPTPDDVFTSYPCHFDEQEQHFLGTVKIVRDPHQNELSQNEIIALRTRRKRQSFRPMFPG